MADSSPSTAQSLYRKWRSRGFFEVVGQEHVTQTLRNAVRTDSVGHAYLFTGPRGTGKTSTARILARAVNCLDPQDGEPCNACAPCQAMLANRCLDVVEIDAASNNSVDDARNLREKVNFAPVEVRRKVYIIDEVHMLSPQAFDALLKTLEEPPRHVMFVLATTDVHKVKATITSRCQRLDFRTIAPRDIVARMAYICAQEGIAADGAALELIAQQATGSLRDALSLLDQVRAYEGTAIGVTEVEQALGLARSETLGELTESIVAGDSGAALALIANLAAAGADMRQYARQLVHYWRDLLLLRAGGAQALGRTPDAQMAAQANCLSVADVTTILKAFLQPDYSGRRSASAQWQLELAVVDACQRFAAAEGQARPQAAAPAAPQPASAVRTGPAARPGREPATAVASNRPSAPPVPDGSRSPSPMVAGTSEFAPRENRTSSPDLDGRAAAGAAPSVDEPAHPGPDGARQGSSPAPDAAPAVDAAPAPDAPSGAVPQETRRAGEIWAQARQLLPAPIDAYVKESCTPRGLEGDTFVLEFPASSRHALYCKQQVESARRRETIEQALAQVLGRAVSLRCVTIDVAPAGAGGASATPSDAFVDRAARHLRALHMERNNPL